MVVTTGEVDLCGTKTTWISSTQSTVINKRSVLRIVGRGWGYM